MKLEYFDMSPSDVALQRNHAMEQVIATLVDGGQLTKEQGEEFLSTFTFVAVRQNSITSRIKKLLFNEKATEDSYTWPLVKL